MLSIQHIGARVRRLRKERGLSVVALAQKAGMSRNTLSSFEHGLGNIEMSRFLAICRALDVGVELLPQRALEAVTADQGGRTLTAVQRLVAQSESQSTQQPDEQAGSNSFIKDTL